MLRFVLKNKINYIIIVFMETILCSLVYRKLFKKFKMADV